jgi:hypothetical protein
MAITSFFVSSFGDDDFAACDEGDVTWPGHMTPEEGPKPHAPREDRGAKALEGARATAWAGPARDAYHRHPSRHGDHRHDEPAPLADHGGSHMRTETGHQCDNSDQGCAPWWGELSSWTTQHYTTTGHLLIFGEGIDPQSEF